MIKIKLKDLAEYGLSVSSKRALNHNKEEAIIEKLILYNNTVLIELSVDVEEIKLKDLIRWLCHSSFIAGQEAMKLEISNCFRKYIK